MTHRAAARRLARAAAAHAHDLALQAAVQRNDGEPEDPLTVPLYESDFTRVSLAPMRQGWHVEYFGGHLGRGLR
jgi:hypothetical protein